MKKTFKAWAIAWAINPKSNENHGFIGPYWWFGLRPSKIPKHLEGCKIALFRTRKEARDSLQHVRAYAFPKAKAARVTVTIEEV